MTEVSMNTLPKIVDIGVYKTAKANNQPYPAETPQPQGPLLVTREELERLFKSSVRSTSQ